MQSTLGKNPPEPSGWEYEPQEPELPRRQRRPDEPIESKWGRLHWTSRKRGILETDLLLSTFADRQRLAQMPLEQLEEYDTLLDENDWDIYYWLTGARTPPPEIAKMTIFPALVEHAKNKSRRILRMPDLE